jgi:hypothetical protein
VRPRSAALTTLLLLAASHAPRVKEGHEPVGVPYEANSTAEMVAAESRQRTERELGCMGGGPPLSHVPQKAGPEASAAVARRIGASSMMEEAKRLEMTLTLLLALLLRCCCAAACDPSTEY